VARGRAHTILAGKIEEALASLPDSYFDCITFNDVLEHLMEPGQVLRMVRPKLSARGITIASIPNFRFFRNLYEIVILKEWEYKESGILDLTHLRFFTKMSMKRLFEEAGFEVVTQEGISPIDTWKFRLLNAATLGILNDTKYAQFVCVARTAGSE
jgi:2-polyprenyl-3-methyl-5-hydroxy-6-metoxy-1,4-benzoquinol methylase